MKYIFIITEIVGNNTIDKKRKVIKRCHFKFIYNLCVHVYVFVLKILVKIIDRYHKLKTNIIKNRT